VQEQRVQMLSLAHQVMACVRETVKGLGAPATVSAAGHGRRQQHRMVQEQRVQMLSLAHQVMACVRETVKGHGAPATVSAAGHGLRLCLEVVQEQPAQLHTESRLGALPAMASAPPMQTALESGRPVLSTARKPIRLSLRRLDKALNAWRGTEALPVVQMERVIV